MADKKKSASTVYPYFVDGEQPTANKFNSISLQVQSNLYVLEKAIGDIWGDSWPYNSNSYTHLSLPIASYTHSGSKVGGSTSGFSSNAASLARLVGPASKLNPIVLSEGLFNQDTGSYGEDVFLTEDISGHGRYSYSLKYRAENPLAGISFTGTGAPSNQVTSPTSVASTGDWYFDSATETCHFYDPIQTDWQVSYTTKPSKGAVGSYNGSSFNVMPDEASMDYAISQNIPGGVLITLTGTYYTVTLPSGISRQNQVVSSSNQTELENSDHNLGAQLKLPNVLREMFGGGSGNNFFDSASFGTADSLIPEGFLYLKNYITGEIYDTAEYYYVNNEEVRIRNVELDLSPGTIYCLITVGTDITSSIQDLNYKYTKHSHNRNFGEQAIDFSTLVGATEEAGNSGRFIESTVSGNYLPQYLHRDGYTSGGTIDSGMNDSNALRGNLMLGLDGGVPGSYIGSGESFRIYYGDENTYNYRGSSGHLYLSNNEGGESHTVDGDYYFRGYSYNGWGDNNQQSTSTDSDFMLSQYTDYTFNCQPNEYRSSPTIRPGQFLFRGAPVYLNGLDSFQSSGNSTSSSSLALGKKRSEVIRENSDKTNYASFRGNNWRCPGIGIATIYLNDIEFATYPNTGAPQSFFEAMLNPGLTTAKPYYLDILLPSIGPGDDNQWVVEDGTNNPGKDVRVTTNQILTINGLIKNKDSVIYSPFNGAEPHLDGVHFQGPTFFLKYNQTPDNETEFIRVLVPATGTCLWDSNMNLTAPQGIFDLRITIMYLTHRE